MLTYNVSFCSKLKCGVMVKSQALEFRLHTNIQNKEHLLVGILTLVCGSLVIRI